MSDELTTPTPLPTPSPNPSVSPWWFLLLVPVALPIGWLVGGLPGPKTVAQQRNGSQVVAGVVSPNKPVQLVEANRPAGGETPLWDSNPRPTNVPQKPEEARPAIISPWSDLQSAMSESQRNGKPVMIDFNAEWCGPCQAMKQEVFDDGAIGPAVQAAVIPVSVVDRRQEEGRNPPEIETLQQRFKVTAFPTLVVFSPETGKIRTTSGFGSANATLGWITEAAKQVAAQP